MIVALVWGGAYDKSKSKGTKRERPLKKPCAVWEDVVQVSQNRPGWC